MDRLKRVQELFDEAVELEPEARREFLYEAAGGDETLITEVEELLRHDNESNDSLYVSLKDQATGAFDERPRRETIGKYRVVRELGQGGMGTVYLATRADDEYQKEVAIKLVPAVVDRDELMRRFRAERQIMASLEHPNIARLLDGDTTTDGIPYVVMEYVRGRPIDQYCKEEHLAVDDKLRLFLKVCDAISHAHRNLIVHRDIKPGNILVSDDGEPKLLDFGIAKILDTSDGPALTRSGMRMMTPEYASPEQARGLPVNTSSDVYSLGVLLNKLLTGALPYDLETREIGGVEKVICEQPPARPGSINPGIDSELDDIVAMALRKEPERRYGTVAAFAGDIERYLTNQPITARRDSAGYRASKFVRRNLLAVSAATLVAVALVGGITMASVGLIRAQQAEAQARREADISKSVAESFVNLFRQADRLGQTHQQVTVAELLDKGIEEITKNVQDQPEALGTIKLELANNYRDAGQNEKAIALFDEAVTAFLSMDTPPPEPMFDAYHNVLMCIRGEREEADHKARVMALAEWQQAHLAGSAYHEALVHRALADFHSRHKRHEESIAAYQRAYALRSKTDRRRQYFGHDLVRIGDELNELARYEEALEWHERALAFFEENPELPVWDYLYRGLTSSYSGVGEHSKAVYYAEKFVESVRQKYTEISPNYMLAMMTLGRIQRDAGNHDQALEILTRTVGMYEQALTGDGGFVESDYTATLFHLGLTQREVERFDDAEATYLRLLEIEARLTGEGSPVTTLTQVELAIVSAETGRFKQAHDRLLVAIENGYPYDDLESMFAPEADRPEFQALFAQHKANLAARQKSD